MFSTVIKRLFLLFFISAAGSPAAHASYSSLDDETPQRVWNIRFEGNEHYSSMALRNIIGLEAPSFFRKLRFWNRSGFDYDSRELRRDEVRIRRFYERRGFPNAQVRSRVEQGRREWVRRVVFDIEEGPPSIITSLQQIIDADEKTIAYLEADRYFQRASRQRILREGYRHKLILHSELEGRYLVAMRNIGFAHAEAYVTAMLDTSGTEAEVVVTLVPGPLAFLGEIIVDGQETVSESVILRQSELKPGDRYDARNLRRAQQQVFGHPLFRFVTVSMPPQPRDTIVDLNIRVREHALRSIRVQSGIGQEEILRGSVSWQHRNPFGNAHHFSTTGRASSLEQYVSMDYLVPYVFNPRSRISISPYGQRLDERGYLLLRAGINNSFIYQLSQVTAATITYELSSNLETIRNPITDRMVPEQDYVISALKLSGYHSQVEVEQYRGWVIRPHAEFSGLLGSGTIRYNRYGLDLRRYIDIGATTQLAVRNDGGLITYSGLEDLPSNVRFYAGGTSSVRGWQRRELGPKRPVLDDQGIFVEYLPVGGKAMYSFNLELRQDMSRFVKRFGFAFFLDGGAVWEDADQADPGALLFGLGAGLRYNSPLGPVRIDLARKINPTDEDLNIYQGADYGGWFDRWGIHFSIGQAF